MIARLLRSFGWEGWLILAGILGLILFLTAIYLSGRRNADADRAARDQRVVTRAAEARETAASERAAATRQIQTDLNERNRDAEQTPDAAPDERELRRACRQLRDAGTTGVPECRGFEG